jgi:hypothetical protein
MRSHSRMVLFTFSLLVFGCGGQQMQTDSERLQAFDAVSPSAWKVLSGKKIYFGHQSVGYNIVEGVEEVAKGIKNLDLHVLESRDPAEFANPVFVHSRVGVNQDPKSKCKDFEAVVDSGVGDKADFAFFKFCYVDIGTKTNIQEVLSQYKDTVHSLQRKYPKTHFIAMTVPLMSQQVGIRSWVKSVFGESNGWRQDNAARCEFNDMLRREFAPDSVFDLAAVESTHNDGTRELFKLAGKTYYAMSQEYTDDGGHLNAKGRIVVAESLLAFLASL